MDLSTRARVKTCLAVCLAELEQQILLITNGPFLGLVTKSKCSPTIIIQDLSLVSSYQALDKDDASPIACAKR